MAVVDLDGDHVVTAEEIVEAFKQVGATLLCALVGSPCTPGQEAEPPVHTGSKGLVFTRCGLCR